MMIMKALDLLPSLVEAERKAGEAILGVYGGAVRAEFKTDASMATVADLLSHKVLSSHLARTSSYPVLSEGGKNIPYDARRHWETFWLVDPLDGTREFISRNGEFTVNAALIHRGQPVMGAIYAPVRDVLYTAVKGGGAYRTAHGETVRLPVDQQRKSCVVVGNRSDDASREFDEYVLGLRTRHEELAFLSAGSSLKFCLVAEGAADLYPRLGTTMEWDTAAGQLLVEEAGGRVIEAGSRRPLRYNKADLWNPHFIAARSGYHA